MLRFCVFPDAHWMLYVGDLLEGLGSVSLGVAFLWALRKYEFGPVAQGLRNISGLVGSSFIAIGIAEVLIVVFEILALPRFFEVIIEAIAGATVFGTALVVLRYRKGILDVLGATNGRTPTDGGTDGADRGRRDTGDSVPKVP